MTARERAEAGLASNEGIDGREPAQETLRRSEERFRALVESSPNAVFLVAKDGTIALVNRQAEALFRYKREELVGLSVENLVPERFRGPHLSYRAEYAATPRQRPMGAGRDLRAVRKDGSEIPVEIGLTPIEMPDGLQTMATITDITERKSREEELRRTAAELARSNEDLAQFARVVSHEVQEPLRVVSQHLETVRRRLGEGLDDETRESLIYAVDASRRMQALVRDILAYSGVGRMGSGFTQTDMEAVLGIALGDLAACIEETGASIQHDRLPTVAADSLLMSQVMRNLLSNAVKFCAKGKAPVIHVGAQREAREWTFRVRDNGIGIAPEDTERVFTMFNRLHPRQEYPGTGIGLALCKKIVEYHGGRIWVESRTGGGSTFFFTIPDRP
jgi:PAS domain S-box-containing protein